MKLSKKNEDANNDGIVDNKTATDNVTTKNAENSDQDYIDIINQQQAQITELTNIAQKTRADFENYRKHTDDDLRRAGEVATEKTIKKLLPIIDVLNTATANVPDDIKDNDWARGVVSAGKNVAKLMKEMGLEEQAVKPGDVFNHDLHEAILFEDGDGEQELIAEVLRPGYLRNGKIIRPAMVKVKK